MQSRSKKSFPSRQLRPDSADLVIRGVRVQPGMVPNAETFGSVLAAMARGAVGAPPAEAAAAAEAALGVFRAMLAAPGGGGADAGAYGALVRLQAAAGQWGRALAVHELMLAQARPPGGACYKSQGLRYRVYPTLAPVQRRCPLW